jgi:hypothetical protein
LLKGNDNVYRDTNYSYIDLTQDSKKVYDTFNNNGSSSLRIYINDNNAVHVYSIRYYRGREDWTTSSEAEIFITYADHYSEGYNNPNYFTKRKLTRIFEKYFIDKIDSILGQKHVE